MRSDIEWRARAKSINIDQIRAFETKCGYKFPRNYIELILNFNAAYIDNYIDYFEIYYENRKKYNNYHLPSFTIISCHLL